MSLENSETMPAGSLRFIRQADVLARTQLSRSTLYELINLGRFPKPLKLCDGRINCWPLHEVEGWMQAQIDERQSASISA